MLFTSSYRSTLLSCPTALARLPVSQQHHWPPPWARSHFFLCQILYLLLYLLMKISQTGHISTAIKDDARGGLSPAPPLQFSSVYNRLHSAMVVLVKTNVYKNASICSITIVSLVANSRSMFQTVNRKIIQLLYIQSPNSYMTDLLLFGLLKCFLPASSSFISLLLSIFLLFVSIKDQTFQRNLKNKTNLPKNLLHPPFSSQNKMPSSSLSSHNTVSSPKPWACRLLFSHLHVSTRRGALTSFI